MSEQNSLTIEYALTRREILQSFVYSMTRSPRFLGTILLYSVAIGIMTMLIRASILRSLTLKDAVYAGAWALGFPIFMAIWASIRGKAAKRTLTVSSNGIATEIGRIKGQVPWDKVRVVQDTSRFVLIARTNGNAFFVPHRAFPGPDQCGHFVAEIRSWMDSDKKRASSA